MIFATEAAPKGASSSSARGAPSRAVTPPVAQPRPGTAPAAHTKVQDRHSAEGKAVYTWNINASQLVREIPVRQEDLFIHCPGSNETSHLYYAYSSYADGNAEVESWHREEVSNLRQQLQELEQVRQREKELEEEELQKELEQARFARPRWMSWRNLEGLKPAICRPRL